eukprot:CAMPEP_0184499884 /NCGR_PEP_ID=MMETSP0113_2-20130426/42893_1 /TAXON_ID=91329 /ORGANISM="Norrisiella sphaerica, Strain BC52" /LENGTH=72 /DNA_ID=CAMNT_0026887993 /DNA_START=193 /DNA_END=412 /DNA_ORIENTATION=+
MARENLHPNPTPGLSRSTVNEDLVLALESVIEETSYTYALKSALPVATNVQVPLLEPKSFVDFDEVELGVTA